MGGLPIQNAIVYPVDDTPIYGLNLYSNSLAQILSYPYSMRHDMEGYERWRMVTRIDSLSSASIQLDGLS